MVNLLLENKSPLNATDVSGLTALHHGECCLCFFFGLSMDAKGGMADAVIHSHI